MIDTATAWEEHRATISAYVRRRLAHEADAEDLVQETFLRLHRAAPALVDRAAVRGWLLRTAHNLLVDHYRASRPHQAVDEATLADENIEPTPLQSLQPCVAHLTANLPEKYQRALTLDLEGVPQQEIAQHSGISLSGAKSRVQRARNLLQREFEQCCEFQQDAQGNLLDYRVRATSNSCAG